jgi:hypothetical protein
MITDDWFFTPRSVDDFTKAMSKEKEQPQHWETVSNSSRRDTEHGTHVEMYDEEDYPNRWSRFRYGHS